VRRGEAEGLRVLVGLKAEVGGRKAEGGRRTGDLPSPRASGLCCARRKYKPDAQAREIGLKRKRRGTELNWGWSVGRGCRNFGHAGVALLRQVDGEWRRFRGFWRFSAVVWVKNGFGAGIASAFRGKGGAAVGVWGMMRPVLLVTALFGLLALLGGCREQTTEERLEAIEERAADAKKDIEGQADAAQRAIDRNAEMTKEAVRRYDEQAEAARAAAEAAEKAAAEARQAAALAEAAARQALTAAEQTSPMPAAPSPSSPTPPAPAPVEAEANP